MYLLSLRRICCLGLALLLLQGHLLAQGSQPAFRDAHLAIEVRVAYLLNRLTLEEKISLLGYQSKPVARLGIPAYNWWNEGLHGVARAGEATVFPQAIALGATFDDSLMQQVGDAIATEARAKYNLAVAAGHRQQYMGLTFWSPNINIFRDPRWGRGQETYGEDPFLTATIGSAYVRGMQGNDPVYLKTSACAKHFAAHSGPEATRHIFNSIVDEKDLRETYLYAFKHLVDAGVSSVMCAYNRLNGQPCCTNNELLRHILRDEWHFKGHVVTDCWALQDVYDTHKVLPNSVAVAGAALKAGVNLDCSNLLQDDVMKAYQQKLLTKGEIDTALAALLRTQFRLGFYDDARDVPYSTLGAESVHSGQSIAIARKAAQESMVLLKNDKSLLPLDKKKYGSLMIIGPNASSLEPLLANYHGMSGSMVTFAEGITAAAGPGIAVQYDQGSDYTDTTHFGGIWAASGSDVTIAVIGLTPVLEGEEGDAFLSAKGGDRANLELPAAHIKLLKALKAQGKPVVAVVTAGSAVDIAAIAPYADAIILAWYPGEQGGTALADVLFGAVSPSGRLPVTFYQSLNDLPAYDDYAVRGRTYRYFKGKVEYPFGYGLSYTTFAYQWGVQPNALQSVEDTLRFAVRVKNTGAVSGDEVVQAYIQYPAGDRMPIKELRSFKRVSVPNEELRTVNFRIPATELQKWDAATHQWKLYPGTYHLLIGSSSQDIRLDKAFTVEG